MITIKQIVDGVTRFYNVNECEFVLKNSVQYSEIRRLVPNMGVNPDLIWHEDDHLPSEDSVYSQKALINRHTSRTTNKEVFGVLKITQGSLESEDKKLHSYKFFYEGDSLSIIANGVIIDLIK